MSTPNYAGIAFVLLVIVLTLLIFRIVAVVRYYKLAFINPIDGNRQGSVARFVFNLILSLVLLAMMGYVGLLMYMAATIEC